MKFIKVRCLETFTVPGHKQYNKGDVLLIESGTVNILLKRGMIEVLFDKAKAKTKKDIKK